MEPIVLMGLIVLVYGGYGALQDLRRDLSVSIPHRVGRLAGHFMRRERDLKPPIKKMAGMHV